CVADPDVAAAAIAPLRALATPLGDMVQPMPYPSIYPPEDPDYRPKAANRTFFLDRVGLETATLIVDRLTASDATMRVTQLRALGGAMARVPRHSAPCAPRRSPLTA